MTHPDGRAGASCGRDGAFAWALRRRQTPAVAARRDSELVTVKPALALLKDLRPVARRAAEVNDSAYTGGPAQSRMVTGKVTPQSTRREEQERIARHVPR